MQFLKGNWPCKLILQHSLWSYNMILDFSKKIVSVPLKGIYFQVNLRQNHRFYSSKSFTTDCGLYSTYSWLNRDRFAAFHYGNWRPVTALWNNATMSWVTKIQFFWDINLSQQPFLGLRLQVAPYPKVGIWKKVLLIQTLNYPN